MPKSAATVSFVLSVWVDGAFEGQYKPVQMRAGPVAVEFSLPASEATVKGRKLIKCTPRGAALLGEAMRQECLQLALERTQGK